MTGDGATTSWDVSADPDVVPVLRRQVRDALLGWGWEQLADDVETVVSELLANVVLHAPGAARVTLRLAEGFLVLEVADAGAAMPAPRLATESGTTGRGLGLVTSLTESWGFAPRTDGMPGKVVWCRFGAQPREVKVDVDVDVEGLLAVFDEAPSVGYEVTVGEAPTELAAAAKDHLDGLLRELALAEGSVDGALPREVVESIVEAVRGFAEARAQLRREITRAQAEGRRRVLVRFSLPAEVADAGEAYLDALAQADAHARDRRMLSLESPAAYRVLREWYVRVLVDGLRRAARHEPPGEVASFEDRLLEELQEQELRARRSELAAQLQEVTAQLAAADGLEQIAKIAVAEGMLALGASGGSVTRPGAGRAVAVVEAGSEVGLTEQQERDALPPGPSSDAIRTATAVFIGGVEDRNARYPHLGRVHPDARSLASLPLAVVGEVVGALRFTWTAPRLFTEPERSYLEGLAAQTAQAVARANALQRLREAEARSRTLARLGGQLAADRSVAGLTDAALDAVVPHLGDWALLHLVDAAGRVYYASGRSRDGDAPSGLAALVRSQVQTTQPYGPGAVIATGVTQRLPVLDEAGVVVPLIARGAVIGALTVGRVGADLDDETVGVVEDIGRRAGIALDNARALSTSVRLELALSAANVGSFEMRLPSGELDWDDRLFDMLELEPGSFDGTLASFFARVLPEDAARVRAAIDAAVETVGELVVEYRVPLQDGTVRWLEGRGQALPGPDGSAERLVGVVVDVTAKRDESTLARRSLELMADGVLQLDGDWRVVYANSQAGHLIRTPRAELVGTSVWDLFPAAVGTVFQEKYLHAVETGDPVRFEAYFRPLDTWFEVRAFPAPEGLAIYFTDVTERRATQQERDRALERLGVLNDVGAAMTATLEVDEALTRLAHRLVPVLGDLVSVDLADHDDVLGARAVVIAGADPAHAEALRLADERQPRRSNPRSAVHGVLHGAPLVRIDVQAHDLDQVAVDAEQRAAYQQVDMRHALVVPLTARGRVFGALSLIRTGSEARPYTGDEEELALELGRRAGLIVDNAAQYDAQRRVAEGLQRSLLPRLPRVDGLELGVAYEPSSSAAKVGGDWYDAFVLADGSLGLVIGDVMGHDIAAAAAMGQLRSVLRTCAADGDEPETVVDRLDRLVTTFAMADLATVVYARLVRRPDGSAELKWSNAGHPPPLLLVPGEPARFLEEGRSTMIGVEVGEPRRPAVATLPLGATLLMYTDGLVERRDTDIDARLELVRTIAQGLVFGSPHDLCQQLLGAVRRDGSSDDVALVALTLT
jgi:serine phosphatase RsbU (regulator of sigma subunit)/PAS domain-containing protein/anti-sigma regulatory factor (Ser/Thr protein kinase)